MLLVQVSSRIVPELRTAWQGGAHQRLLVESSGLYSMWSTGSVSRIRRQALLVLARPGTCTLISISVLVYSSYPLFSHNRHCGRSYGTVPVVQYDKLCFISVLLAWENLLCLAPEVIKFQSWPNVHLTVYVLSKVTRPLSLINHPILVNTSLKGKKRRKQIESTSINCIDSPNVGVYCSTIFGWSYRANMEKHFLSRWRTVSEFFDSMRLTIIRD